MTELTELQKARISLYHWMDGRGYHKACEAMNFAEHYHDGKRSGGAPEFSHQIWIANHTRLLPVDKEDMEDLLTLSFLHDVCEDKKVSYDEIEKRFGKNIRNYVEAISKEYFLTKEKKTPEQYYKGLIKFPLVVIVKGVDRLHNLTTMYGPFSRTKQEKYIDETKVLHLPLLKEARKIFSIYTPCFESIKQDINTRIQLIQERHIETDLLNKRIAELESSPDSQELTSGMRM